jgi:hypothetical protein
LSRGGAILGTLSVLGSNYEILEQGGEERGGEQWEDMWTKK